MVPQSMKAEALRGYQFFPHPDSPSLGVLRLDTYCFMASVIHVSHSYRVAAFHGYPTMPYQLRIKNPPRMGLGGLARSLGTFPSLVNYTNFSLHCQVFLHSA